MQWNRASRKKLTFRILENTSGSLKADFDKHDTCMMELYSNWLREKTTRREVPINATFMMLKHHNRLLLASLICALGCRLLRIKRIETAVLAYDAK